ncbi:MAG TPA: T9SS type A sorting domain-containing protein, partial [Flavipsychrobacter sp.]|nr:T9SS type A sorting domain-containing protein [Flavipsychrobacter sp.]
RRIDVNGIITTIAGTGVAGYNGDGGLADTSKLWIPSSVTLDSVGNIFIADGSNNRVRKIDAGTGIISTIAGTGVQGFGGDNGPALSAMLSGPNDICFDKFGNLYVSDANNFRIRKINPSGVITTVVGTGLPGYNGDNIQAATAQLYTCRGVATDSSGNLYIAEMSGNRVRKVDISSGLISTIAGTGIPNYNGDSIQGTAANIGPMRVAFDMNWVLYIVDNYNNRIRKIDQNGVIYTVVGNGIEAFGGDGGLAMAASLNSPSGIIFDTCNNLYITEVNQGRIRKVTYNDSCGILSTRSISKSLDLSIWPNPAYAELSISSSRQLKEVFICNAMGQMVLRQQCNANTMRINVEGLPGGIYFVRVVDVNGGARVEKVLKTPGS